MTTENYYHSVNNHLLLEFHAGSLAFLVCNRQMEPLKTGSFALIDDTMLASLLTENVYLNQIYSSVQVIYTDSPFVIAPSALSGSTTNSKIFELSHRLRPDNKLQEGHLSSDISVLFANQKSTSEILINKFPALVNKHVLELLYNWLHTINTKPGNDLIACYAHEKLLLMAFKEGKIVLANDYDCKSMEDVFFYVMSAIEQLNLNPELLNLNWLDVSDSVEFSLVHDLFHNFIQQIDHKSIFKSTNEIKVDLVGFQCALACA